MHLNQKLKFRTVNSQQLWNSDVIKTTGNPYTTVLHNKTSFKHCLYHKNILRLISKISLAKYSKIMHIHAFDVIFNDCISVKQLKFFSEIQMISWLKGCILSNILVSLLTIFTSLPCTEHPQKLSVFKNKNIQREQIYPAFISFYCEK